MNSPNDSEFVQLIARHQPRLRGLVRCLLVRPSDVDDVLQEVNAVIWEKSSTFDPKTDFWAWASQIARFKALNHVRSYSRERLVFSEALMDALADVAVERVSQLSERREALEACLSQLPPAQRQLVDLRYASGQAIEAIAELIGRPAGSVRQALYRVRLSLLACMESKLGREGASR